MMIRRCLFILLGILWGSISAAGMDLGMVDEIPGESIGIDILVYPELDVVPGYPVYYAPRMHANYFFYDGMYWVYQDDIWYMGSWYDGPWWIVDPMEVPDYILRVPIRYYRQPPIYFRQWMPDAPPHWEEHWGADWERHRRGWNRWDPYTVPQPAPLPRYQRHYSGARYPRFIEQQREIETQHYRYRPRDPEVWRHYRGPSDRGMPAERNPRRHDFQNGWPNDPSAPRFQSPRDSEGFFGSAPDLPQPGGMDMQAPPGQSPQSMPAQRGLWAPSAADQQDDQDSNDTARTPKKQKQ